MTTDMMAIVAIATTSNRILFIECVLTGYPAGQYCRRWFRGECRTCPSHSIRDYRWARSLTDTPDGGPPYVFRSLRPQRCAVRHSEDVDWGCPYCCRKEP